jgi:hypothetical protein
VLVCQVGGHVRDSAGTWTAVTATSRDGSPADVASLVATLDRQIAATAGAGVPSPDPSTCAGQAKPVVLWLLDAIDRAVRPSVPVDSCGSPARELLTALDRLTVTGVVDQPVQLVTPSP